VCPAMRDSPTQGPSAVYPIIEKFVNDEYVKLDHDQITPWAFLHSGVPFTVKRFHGSPIAYSGILFAGSPQIVFWNGYIEPFLEDIAFRAIDLTMREAPNRKIPLREPLLEVQGQLHGLCRRAFDRMANIDQRLRGGGFPAKVQLRNTDKELARMHQFIDKRIAAELRAIPVESSPWMVRLNQWQKENPFLFWLIPLSVAIFGLLGKISGLF
jgi:hypothetical protein